MVEWEPLIELKGAKRKKQYDQRKRFREYTGGSLHCTRKHGTLIILCYVIAGNGFGGNLENC